MKIFEYAKKDSLLINLIQKGIFLFIVEFEFVRYIKSNFILGLHIRAMLITGLP